MYVHVVATDEEGHLFKVQLKTSPFGEHQDPEPRFVIEISNKNLMESPIQSLLLLGFEDKENLRGVVNYISEFYAPVQSSKLKASIIDSLIKPKETTSEEIVLENEKLSLTLSSNGLLEKITEIGQSKSVQIEAKFVVYRSVQNMYDYIAFRGAKKLILTTKLLKSTKIEGSL